MFDFVSFFCRIFAILNSEKSDSMWNKFHSKHKMNAKPSYACRYCYAPHPKPNSNKARHCRQCLIGLTESQAIVYWDSQAELSRWAELRLLERDRVIHNLELKPVFRLHYNGTLIKSIRSYEADYAYDKDGIRIVEDNKGMRTQIYKIKKELVEIIYGIKVLETQKR